MTYYVIPVCYAPTIKMTAWRHNMEAITIAGVAVLAVGGYYAAVDFLNDLGLRGKRVEAQALRVSVSRRSVVTPQTGIKKMAGMHI
jgi:hypothetical protein